MAVQINRTAEAGGSEEPTVHRELRAGEAEAIADLHGRLYPAEFGLDDRFRASVWGGIESALERGWPASSGAVWLVDEGGELAGSLALTEEGGGLGQLRWFLLAPRLRGRGLGRRLVDELLAEARALGLRRIELETFSALTAAARIYRDAGFRLLWARETDRWGPPIVYQRYRLELGPRSTASAGQPTR